MTSTFLGPETTRQMHFGEHVHVQMPETFLRPYNSRIQSCYPLIVCISLYNRLTWKSPLMGLIENRLPVIIFPITCWLLGWCLCVFQSHICFLVLSLNKEIHPTPEYFSDHHAMVPNMWLPLVAIHIRLAP